MVESREVGGSIVGWSKNKVSEVNNFPGANASDLFSKVVS